LRVLRGPGASSRARWRLGWFGTEDCVGCGALAPDVRARAMRSKAQTAATTREPETPTARSRAGHGPAPLVVSARTPQLSLDPPVNVAL
jgi:hypothetical protein